MMDKRIHRFAMLFLCLALAVEAAPKLWQQEGIVISDFSKVAQPQSALMREVENVRDKWQLVDYESLRYNGTMLYSRPGTVPAPVTIDPKLKGWHRIYIGTFAGLGFRLWARLTNDASPSMFTQQSTSGRGFWSTCEQGEEIFWKCADLTDQTITFGKPGGTVKAHRAGIMWLRFEPMTEEEITEAKSEFTHQEHKRLHAHSDMDWISIYGPNATMDEYCSIIDAYGHSDVELATIEVYTTLADMKGIRDVFNSPEADLLESRWASQLALDERRAEVYQEYARRAHQYGIKVLAGHRMSLANFIIPHDDICASRINFVTENPQWRCRDRDGETIDCLSYAYPEVGDFMIKEFLKMADMGFDGATLILTRGIMLLFEEPILRRFEELYPGIDPATLPLTDSRLAAVRCEFFTGFMRRMRAAFDNYSKEHNRPRLLINTYVDFSLDDNLFLGLDVATWIREGLIDCVSAACMRVYEDEGGLKDDKNPGLLSVAKYTEMKKSGAHGPIWRHYGNNPDREIKYIPEWKALTDRYGVKVYFDIQWEGSLPPEKIADYALRLYNAGAENLSMWDCFEYRISCRPEWYVTSRLGHRELLPALPRENQGYRRLFRIRSLNGVQYTSYYPNWRG